MSNQQEDEVIETPEFFLLHRRSKEPQLGCSKQEDPVALLASAKKQILSLLGEHVRILRDISEIKMGHSVHPKTRDKHRSMIQERMKTLCRPERLEHHVNHGDWSKHEGWGNNVKGPWKDIAEDTGNSLQKMSTLETYHLLALKFAVVMTERIVYLEMQTCLSEDDNHDVNEVYDAHFALRQYENNLQKKNETKHLSLKKLDKAIIGFPGLTLMIALEDLNDILTSKSDYPNRLEEFLKNEYVEAEISNLEQMWSTLAKAREKRVEEGKKRAEADRAAAEIEDSHA